MPLFSNSSANTGMNAELKVPSPSILRKRLGRVKARMKAEAIAEDPKQEKNRISRKRPRTREIIVNPLTTERLLASLLIASQQAFSSIPSTSRKTASLGHQMGTMARIQACPPTPYARASHSLKRERASASGPSWFCS